MIKCKPGINHHPRYPGIWVPYNGHRFKMEYDITLKNGRIVENVYPNGISFGSTEGEFKDDEVAMVRLRAPDQHEFVNYKSMEDFVKDASRHHEEDELPVCVVGKSGNLIAFI